jgi:hypothetical protein
MTALDAAIVFKKFRRFDWSAGEDMDWLFILFDRLKLGMTVFVMVFVKPRLRCRYFRRKVRRCHQRIQAFFGGSLSKKVDRNYVSLCHASFVEIYL